MLAKLASDGWTSELLYARGELYRTHGRPEDLTAATGFYRQAVTAPDAPAEAWRGLGLSAMRSGKAEEGKAALREYLTRKPDANDRSMVQMMLGGVS